MQFGCIPVGLCVVYYENVHQLLRVRNAGMMEQRNVSVKITWPAPLMRH